MERGEEVLPQLTSAANIATCHYLVGQALVWCQRPAEAIDRLRTARDMFETQGDIVGAIESMAFESSALSRIGDRRDLAVAEEALRRCRALDPMPPDTESRLLTRVATALFKR